MSSSHVTSATIPRFALDRMHSPFPVRPSEALRVFSLGLEFGAIEQPEVRAWAVEVTTHTRFVPAWVWELREGRVPVRDVVHRELPYTDVADHLELALAILFRGVDEGRLDAYQAGRYIRDARNRGEFAVWDDTGGYNQEQIHRRKPYTDAVTAFVTAWNREDFFRTTGEPRSGPEDTPDLDHLLRRFREAQEAWNQYWNPMRNLRLTR